MFVPVAGPQQTVITVTQPAAELRRQLGTNGLQIILPVFAVLAQTPRWLGCEGANLDFDFDADSVDYAALQLNFGTSD